MLANLAYVRKPAANLIGKGKNTHTLLACSVDVIISKSPQRAAIVSIMHLAAAKPMSGIDFIGKRKKSVINLNLSPPMPGNKSRQPIHVH